MTKQLKLAYFWQYTGNHIGGQDCERYDPHNFGIDLIKYIVYLFVYDSLPGDCTVIKGRSDDYGIEIKIAADDVAWDYAKKMYLLENNE